MRIYQYEKFEGIDSLAAAEVPMPRPEPGQVLVRVRAVSLNYKDLFIAKGITPRKGSGPLVPLSDAAGDVVKVGSEVDRVAVGDRVVGLVAPKWIGGGLTPEITKSVLGTTINGVLAEYIVLSAEAVLRFPSHLNWEQAVTLPCAAATAWNALVGQAAIKAGDTVLIQGSGGVSVFALQFAKVSGARILATSSSNAKLARLCQLGASVGINYRTHPDWDEHVLRETDSLGVDHVVEVGGAGTLEKSLRAVRMGGTISLVGTLAGLDGAINPFPVLSKAVRLQGISVGPRDVFERMNRAISQHGLRPVIDRTFQFDEAREALHYLESGKHLGKIVIKV